MSHRESISIIRDEHSALAAVLDTLQLLVRKGPGDSPARFFVTVRAMLFYIDEYPERLHHPKESRLLFPRVAAREPTARATIERLDREHRKGEAAVRELQHLLMGWEFHGESRQKVFVDALEHYLTFYEEHMRLEETEILPAAERHLSEQDWDELDRAFAENQDPLTGKYPSSGLYADFLKRIVNQAPQPFGLGE